MDSAEKNLWVFGYGSLMWRPEFEYRARCVGFVRGWQRWFFQGSTDHRGVPGAPGRVVTLLPSANGVCWGVAFRPSGEAASVLKSLDYREKGGYRRMVLPFFRGEGVRLPPQRVLIYLAGRDNPNYLGPAPLADMAAQIARAHGPSGANSEYLFKLAATLRAMSVTEQHVFELEERVRQHLGRAMMAAGPGGEADPVGRGS